MKQGLAYLSGDMIHIKADVFQRDVLRSLPHSHWDVGAKRWALPATSESVRAIRHLPWVRLDRDLSERFPDTVFTIDPIYEDVRPISPMLIRNATPRPHQVTAYNQCIQTITQAGGYALLHEQGLGKTLTAIAVLGRLFEDYALRRVLIVSPVSVLPGWLRELEQYADYPYCVAEYYGSKTPQQRARELAHLRQTMNEAPAVSIVLTSYDMMRRPDVATILADWRPEMVVLDESQKIKAHNTATAKIAHALGKRARYRLILTGTPVGNNPLDLWSQYHFLQPGLLDRSYWAAKGRYAVWGGYGGHELLMFTHLDELAAKVHSISHRATKAQSLLLPDRIDQSLWCTLEPAAMRLYKQLQRDALAELSADKAITAPRIITRMLRFSQITGGFVQPDDGTIQPISEAKLNLLREVLEDLIDRGEKVVIFVRFRPEIAAIQALATELVGTACVVGIWGDVSTDKRDEAIQRFQTDPAVRLFIAQIQAAGSGITLHAAATAIFYSMDYSYLNYEQAKARIHRIGQTRPCTYIHLIAKGTIDEQVLGALEQKRSLADGIVDHWKDLLQTNKTCPLYESVKGGYDNDVLRD